MADLGSDPKAVTSNKVGKPLVGVPIDSRKNRNLGSKKKGKK
tara:strand:- start:755 stop:880 length:126 start_codon:yes stop_codon:yes gene_type:complete